MWLYLPSSTTSRFAPGAVASTWDLNSQCEILAHACTWRGKPSRSRIWFQRWKRASWLRLLCGAMPEPSTAALGVERWTASLAAYRASRTALPVASAGSTTSETSGAQPAAPLSKPAPGSSSSKTSAACSRRGMTKSLEPKGFGETYASWVSRLRQDCSQRRKLARRMSASASSSSAWPTPDAFVSNDAESPESFEARRANLKARGINGNGAGTPPAIAAKAFEASAWPTPTSRDWKDTGNLDNVPENALLGRVAANWSTPRSTDGEKGGPNQSFGAGGVPLAAQTAQWATPRSHEVGQYQYSKGDKTKPIATLTGQAISRPDPAPSMNGDPSSPQRRTLNPLFVSWLMGWPPIASIGCGFSETEWCHWFARMRSALSQLDLPGEAPPAQLALFG